MAKYFFEYEIEFKEKMNEMYSFTYNSHPLIEWLEYGFNRLIIWTEENEKIVYYPGVGGLTGSDNIEEIKNKLDLRTKYKETMTEEDEDGFIEIHIKPA